MALLDAEMARAWYPEADPVHGFDHILRVAHMALRLASAEGADPVIVWAAALLHDAQPPSEETSGEARLAHHLVSANFAGRILLEQGWSQPRIAAVQHCIRAHRFRDDRENPQTLEAQVLFDADKLDAIGAIGAARAIAFAAQRGQPAFDEPSRRFLESGELEPGEAYSAYHEYRFKLVKLLDRFFTPSARLLAHARHDQMMAFFERLRDEALALSSDRPIP